MKKSRYRGVYTDGRNFYTLSRYGESVYGERVIKTRGGFFHLWNPFRSKLGAAMHLRLKNFPFQGSRLLYLGASTGTTVSHVSDLTRIVWAVEISPIAAKKLVSLAERRDNIVPILEDARRVDSLALFVSDPDVLYQDISQRDQVEIFLRNMERFTPKWGFLMLKTRTIDMRARPRDIMERSRRKIEEAYEVREVIDLSRFQKDHYAIVVKG